jgi:quercetin dioxygenase-like cupin family protein
MKVLFFLTVLVSFSAIAVEKGTMTFEELDKNFTTNTRGAGTTSESSFFPVGDGKKAEIFSIVFNVRPNTQIQAHSHPDSRSCFVLKGEWNIGYGDVFDKAKLKHLLPGSNYTEPANTNHFAATMDSEAIVECTGMGPTGTTFAKAK